MLNKITNFFSPIVFPDDGLLTLRSRILNVILNIVLLFGFGITVVGLFTTYVPPMVLLVDSSLIPAALIIRVIYRKQRIDLAAVLLITLGFVIITSVIIAMGSVHSPTTSTLLLLIVLATVYTGKIGGLISSVISSLIIFALLWVDENTAFMPDVFTQTGTAIPSMITYSMVFITTSLVLAWLFDRLLKDQMNQKTANNELEARVKARTEELQKSKDALELLNGELIRADRMKDEFLANMSHELRTPLTGILGLTEAIRFKIYGELNEKQDELLSNVEQSGQHLLSMINDILDLSKIEANKMDIDSARFRADSVCEASVRIVKGMAGKKKIELLIQIEPKDLTLTADPKRLKQALVNLLSNAVKFTPENGKVGLAVAADAENSSVTFSVWDTGIGINLADQSRLFQPFVQLDGSLSRQNSGTGLGLSLVRKLVEIQGGSVKVESEVGQGSRFSISLPWYSQDDSTARTDGIEPSLRDLPRSERPFKIMLVDDNIQFLETVRDGLSYIGHDVRVYSAAVEALGSLASDAPDVILTDIQMPLVNGLEFAKRVRSSDYEAAATVPIIALTALAMAGDEQRCLDAGMNKYLPKPISIAKLSKIISEFVH